MSTDTSIAAANWYTTSTRGVSSFPAREYNPGEFVVSTDSSYLFGGSYSGINENLPVGSQIYYSKQGGIDRSGTTLGIG